jgi:hypothetical protein
MNLAGIMLMTLWMAVPTSAPATQKPPTTGPKAIYAGGCVQAGVEAGCLVLKSRGDKVYTLLIKGKKPAIGSAIRFTGTLHDGPTTCMQGEAVDVKQWTPIKMKCSVVEEK